MGDLLVLRNSLSYEERIQNKINGFRREMMAGDGDMAYVEEVLNICYDYLCDFEDNDVYNAAVKVKESVFYLNAFMIE